MQLHERLKALLKVAGITHAELAEDMGLSTRQITRVVSGVSVPQPDTIAKWCQVLGVDPGVIMADRPSMLDIVLMGISSLTTEERKFILDFIAALDQERGE